MQKSGLKVCNFKCWLSDTERLHAAVITRSTGTVHTSAKARVNSVAIRNYRLFVSKTFRSQERKVPVENIRSPGTKTFVLGERKFRALSFSGTFVPGERKFRGTFVPGTFRTRELSFPLSDGPSRRFALCA